MELLTEGYGWTLARLQRSESQRYTADIEALIAATIMVAVTQTVTTTQPGSLVGQSGEGRLETTTVFRAG